MFVMTGRSPVLPDVKGEGGAVVDKRAHVAGGSGGCERFTKVKVEVDPPPPRAAPT